jgi:type IV secretion system protein VirB1
MQAGARVLHTGYDPCMAAGGEPQACLRRAATIYNTGSPDRGFSNGYVMRIAATAQHVTSAIAAAGQQAPDAQQQKPESTEPAEPFDLGSGDDGSLTTAEALIRAADAAFTIRKASP